MHRVYLPDFRVQPGEKVVITDDEAAHALRVKRLEPGETIELLNGSGLVARATVEPHPGKPKSKHPELHVCVTEITSVAPPSPALDVLTATPKGSHVDEMIQQLAQVGAASWGPLHTARGVVDPRDAKLARLERIAVEAGKQCGRAHRLLLMPPTDFARALAVDKSTVVIADASGESPDTLPKNTPMRLLVGPEGGFTDDELAQAKAAGAKLMCFGPHVMRIETAAVVAAGVIMSCSTKNTPRGMER